MRRPTTLEVDTVASHELVYELDTSPTSSLYTIDVKHSPSTSKHSIPLSNEQHPPSLSPSIRLLFSQITRQHFMFFLLPAILCSMIAGGIAPFMTIAVGQVFDAFAHFPLTPNPPQSAKDQLLRDVGIACLELLGLAIGSLALSSINSSLWIWTGEHNVMALRKRVYESVTRREMSWFDTKLGDSTLPNAKEDDNGPIGAAGLMTKFTSETDDVRTASSLASGMLVQYLTTCITCLILAFVKSWALTLVILSSVPLLMIVQAFSQATAGPLLNSERTLSAVAGTLIDRATAAIATVKAFNASKQEQRAFSDALSRMKTAEGKVNFIWGLTSGVSQFVMMTMFVQGFWFGSKLVREGTVAAGDVMAVFWACLIATSNFQMCLPHLITVNKGKFAMVSLLSLIDHDASSPSRTSRRTSNSGRLRGITPQRCLGELAMHNVTFAYPSRPDDQVLNDVSIYLPSNEMTFIVGGSGSGKSTIAQLLLKLYSPQSGSIQLDDHDLNFLDDTWLRRHVAGVSQECVLFDLNVHDNVAIGLAGTSRKPQAVTRKDVIDACTATLVHEFVRDLPDGYDTTLGIDGTNLSGGQKQRIALARAKLRNPPILILDEATSALDPTSRILVFEAIKQWRAGKTTVVITHDLSQITASDFVYVLKQGRVVEQGYRYDLETSIGEFRAMMDSQTATGGCLPTKTFDDTDSPTQIFSEDRPSELPDGALHRLTLIPDASRASRHLTLNWMFDVVADLTNMSESDPQQKQEHRRSNAAVVMQGTENRYLRRPSSVHVLPALPPVAESAPSRRRSLQFTPTSPVFSIPSPPPWDEQSCHSRSIFDEKIMEYSGDLACARRQNHTRLPRSSPNAINDASISVENPKNTAKSSNPEGPVLALLRAIYPTVPFKPLIAMGLIICVASGAMTPVFSFLLSRLLFEVSIGAQNVSLINTFGGIVLGVAALDGLFMGLKYIIMESAAMLWVERIRNLAYGRVLAQDKKWFDKSENSPVRIGQIIMKDGEDARGLIAVVIGQCLVVFTMLSLGLIWALIRGWQLTLVGFAIAPIFAITMAVQTRLITKCELRNKRAREDVSKKYYQVLAHIRSIRSMSLESVFQRQFDKAADTALYTGVKGAFVEGCTFGVASGLIYLAEAILFYVGAILIARGLFTYLQMVETLNLVVFTVTISSQLMVFTEKIARSLQATRDFNTLLHLSTETDESRGVFRPPFEGNILFNNVSFSYPERPDVPVLRNLNLEIFDGELVAIVGTSGSGKSTIASLLQRLYEPTQGAVSLGLDDLRTTNVAHLRNHVSVVNQQPHLFDASVSKNIMYGAESISEADIRSAAKAANVHEFIMSLPNGYDTHVGENASLISGGQAQRIQIARAFVRPSKVMILDECTSALDSANQTAILDSVSRARIGRTIIMITHKIPIMRLCDRVVLIHDGKVVEDGSYDDLIRRKGEFSRLASGGEWLGE